MAGFRIGDGDGMGVVFRRIVDELYGIGFISEGDKTIAFTLDSRVCFLGDHEGVLYGCKGGRK